MCAGSVQRIFMWWKRELPHVALPLIPGHQAVGTVAGVGPGGQERGRGDPYRDLPGCEGPAAVCQFLHQRARKFVTEGPLYGYQVDGGFADYAVVPAALPIPFHRFFRTIEAAPSSAPGIIGYRALRLSGTCQASAPGLYDSARPLYCDSNCAASWMRGLCEFVKDRASDDSPDISAPAGSAERLSVLLIHCMPHHLCAGRRVGPSGLARAGARRHACPGRHPHVADSVLGL